jgi:hypothetical protein
MPNNFNSLLVMAVVTKLPISNKNNKILPGIIFVIILDVYGYQRGNQKP